MTSQHKSLSLSDYELRVTNLARFIYNKIGKKPGKLIDIGAGNGMFLRFFNKKGFEVAGMELSPELCEAMRKSPLMKGISVFPGDISKKTGSGEYDYVIASDVIEHINNEERALKNLYSFVKPGGLLIISVPAHQFLFGKRDKLWGHYRRYDKDKLITKIEKLRGGVEFVSYWNFAGYFAYFFYEKILGKPVKENFRYSSSLPSRIFRGFLDFVLRVETLIGYIPWGLTLVAIVRKNK